MNDLGGWWVGGWLILGAVVAAVLFVLWWLRDGDD